MGQVYIVAGEYCSLPGEVEYGPSNRAFRPAGDPELEVRPLALEALLHSAGERALHSLRDDAVRDGITDLLVTTMPGTKPTGLALGLYATRLKRSLGLGLDCRTRFEVGSSDAGASVFASAVQLLESDCRTALVVAGQTMPRGSAAISDVARVLDPDDRRFNLNMINIGDLLFDLHLRHWGLQEAVEQLWPDGGTEAFLDALLQRKLACADDYPAAYRSGADIDIAASPWFSPWMRRCDIAPATNGACAVLLTSDPELVKRWLARSWSNRVVRVLGVGEGEAATSVLGRTSPLGYHRAIRQALTMLCRETGVSLDFLRSAGVAIIHDAFPSIELAFLTSLGLSPLDAVQRMLTYWTNPWGGLTTFSHSMAASGLVQVVKAFHLFTGPQRPELTTTAGPFTCLTTSVGGPLSHIVTTLIQSVEMEGSLPPPFEPLDRHRFHEPLRGDFEEQCRWVETLAREHLTAVAQALGPDVAMLEARTGQYLPLLPLPLPAELLANWTPGPVRYRSAELFLTPDEVTEWKALLGEADGVRNRDRMAVWTQRFADKAAHTVDGFETLDPQRVHKDLRGALFNHLRPLTGMAMILSEGQLRRIPVLLTDATADAPAGALIRLSADIPVAIGTEVITGHPQLQPLWTPWQISTRLTAEGEPFLEGDEASRALTTARDLLGANTTCEHLQNARSMALGIARKVRQRGDAPPPAALELIGHLANRSSPSPVAVARSLAAIAGGSAEPEHTAIGFCQISLNFDDAGGPRAAALSRVGAAMRRAEGWLGGTMARHARVGDTFAVSLHDVHIEDNLVTAVSLVRFGRDVYQDCAAVGLPVKVVIYVGDGRVFRDPGHLFDATSRGEAAARSLVRWGREFQEGPGIAVLRQGTIADAGVWIERVWTAVSGEQLVAIDPPKAGVTPRYQDLVYQVRRRKG